MSYTTIESLLETQLKTVVGLPALNTENTRYAPKPNTPWSRSTFLPAIPQTESLGTGGKKQVSGIFAVDLFYPTDSGTTTANTMADAVVSAFSASTNLTSGDMRVYLQQAGRSAAQPFNNFYQIPVLIYWFAFVQK